MTFNLIDNFGYIKGVLLYIAYMLPFSIFLYGISGLPKFLSPMESIMVAARPLVNLPFLLGTYLPIILPIVLMKLFCKYEVE